jgi:hypothetical protein
MINGHYRYVGAEAHDYHLVDVSNPAGPTPLATIRQVKHKLVHEETLPIFWAATVRPRFADPALKRTTRQSRFRRSGTECRATKDTANSATLIACGYARNSAPKESRVHSLTAGK